MSEDFNVKKLDATIRQGAVSQENIYSSLRRNPYTLKRKYYVGKTYKKGGVGSSVSGKAKNKAGKKQIHNHVEKTLVLLPNGKKRFMTIQEYEAR